MMRTVKKIANSDNCESYDIENPSFLSLKNRGLVNHDLVDAVEHENKVIGLSLQSEFGARTFKLIYDSLFKLLLTFGLSKGLIKFLSLMFIKLKLSVKFGHILYIIK